MLQLPDSLPRRAMAEMCMQFRIRCLVSQQSNQLVVAGTRISYLPPFLYVPISKWQPKHCQNWTLIVGTDEVLVAQSYRQSIRNYELYEHQVGTCDMGHVNLSVLLRLSFHSPQNPPMLPNISAISSGFISVIVSSES